MTAKKDLKKLVRQRQATTGERYVTALSHVRSRGPRPAVEVELSHDLSRAARLEGFACRVVASEALWSGGPTQEQFRPLLSAFRAMLEALEGESGAEALVRAALRGEPWSGVPNAVQELAEARRFMVRARAGVRGVSRTGRLVAFDATLGDEPLAVLGVCLAPARLLSLTLLEERGASGGWGESLAQQLQLAGLGGLTEGSHR